jgi:anaerobic magnesium-protoporphyrin IX monomethyl ester cyclase
LTLEELIPALQSGRPEALAGISGIAFRGQDGQVRRTPARTQIPDIDRQPWPDRDLIDIDRYVQTWRTHHGTGSVSLITARGCPYRCRWCSHEVFGKTHRRRKPASVADELEWLMNRYQPDMAWIADDVFTIHPGWLSEYAAEMRRRSLKLPFECISRADRLNAEVIDHLAELGCFRIWIGSESGSQRILDAMERGVTVAQVQTAVALCKSRGIQTGMFLMWGYAGEEMEDIEATVAHVKRTNPDVFLTTVSYPIKGTPYFSEVAPRVVSSRAWAEGSDRDYAIRGRHSRRFYKFADQLLRSEVALARSANGQDQAGDSSLAGIRGSIEEARAGLRSAFTEAEA